MAGKAYSGPIIMRVGERTGKSRYAKDEFILAAPGTVIAPRLKSQEPTLENAAKALLKQVAKTKIPGAQLGGSIWKNPTEGTPGPVQAGKSESGNPPEGVAGMFGNLYNSLNRGGGTGGNVPANTQPNDMLNHWYSTLSQMGLSPDQIKAAFNAHHKVMASGQGVNPSENTPYWYSTKATAASPGGPGFTPPSQMPTVPPADVQVSQTTQTPIDSGFEPINQAQTALTSPQLPPVATPERQQAVDRLSTLTNILSGLPAFQPLAQRLGRIRDRIVSGYGTGQAAGPKYLPQ